MCEGDLVTTWTYRSFNISAQNQQNPHLPLNNWVTVESHVNKTRCCNPDRETEKPNILLRLLNCTKMSDSLHEVKTVGTLWKFCLHTSTSRGQMLFELLRGWIAFLLNHKSPKPYSLCSPEHIFCDPSAGCQLLGWLTKNNYYKVATARTSSKTKLSCKEYLHIKGVCNLQWWQMNKNVFLH